MRAARAAGQRVKADGTSHSFNDIALAPDLRIDLSTMSNRRAVDSSAVIQRIERGMDLVETQARQQVPLGTHGIGAPSCR